MVACKTLRERESRNKKQVKNEGQLEVMARCPQLYTVIQRQTQLLDFSSTKYKVVYCFLYSKEICQHQASTHTNGAGLTKRQSFVKIAANLVFARLCLAFVCVCLYRYGSIYNVNNCITDTGTLFCTDALDGLGCLWYSFTVTSLLQVWRNGEKKAITYSTCK